MVTKYSVELTLVEDMLGTVALNKDIYGAYIATKVNSPDKADEEIATVEELEIKGMTGFHRHDGKPFIYDYMIKGFLKAACGAMRRVPDSLSSKQKAYKTVIDQMVFVYPRKIVLQLSGELTTLERPLRCETMHGPRVALAKSEVAPAGTKVEFNLVVLGVATEAILREWMDFGQFSGLGQWRSGGYGRLSYALTKLDA
jgi:hypothetical protein